MKQWLSEFNKIVLIKPKRVHIQHFFVAKINLIFSSEKKWIKFCAEFLSGKWLRFFFTFRLTVFAQSWMPFCSENDRALFNLVLHYCRGIWKWVPAASIKKRCFFHFNLSNIRGVNPIKLQQKITWL